MPVAGVLLPLALLVSAPPQVAQASDAWAPAADVPGLCGLVARKLASVGLQECLDRELRDTGAKSVLGSPIAAKEYPPLPGVTPVARVLLVGGIHGDEYSSVTIVFKWMATLDEHHSGLFHWQVAPLVNPDGLLRRRSQRMNANGVDLNRNFPTPGWAQNSRHYWVQRTGRNPRRYPGEAPLSEPEADWLHDMIETFRPDAIISVHAPHGIVDYDGPETGPVRLGYLNRRLLGTYPGSLGNFAGVHRRIPIITLELASSGRMPPDGEISRIWMDLVRWLRDEIPQRRLARDDAERDEVAPQAGPS